MRADKAPQPTDICISTLVLLHPCIAAFVSRSGAPFARVTYEKASHNSNTPDYTGRGNVTLFLQLAAEADLFVIWRIGSVIY